MTETHLNKIKEIILKFATKLNSKNYIWFLGGSSGLMVHGINIIPHDIDIFIDKNYIESICNEFLPYIKEPLHDYNWQNKPNRRAKFLINNIEIEIIEIRQPENNLQKKEFNDQLIPVHSLEEELAFYKTRPEKEATVLLIEEKLKQR